MALISGSLPPQTCYGTPQQMLDLFAQYLSSPTQNIILDSGSLSFPPASAAGSKANGSATDVIYDCAGSSTGDAVVVPVISPDTGLVFSGWVSTPNTVTIRCTNASGVSKTLTTGQYNFKVKVIKFG